MDGVDKNSKNGEESKVSNEVVKNDDSRGAEEDEKKPKDEVVVDIDDDDNGGSRNVESSKSETVCRICHFVDEESSGDSQLIALGCDCSGDIGFSHRTCASTWFSQKRNRVCEICGKIAKNVNISNNNNNNNYEDDERARMMMDLNDMRLILEALDSSNESRRRCKISFCNFLLICLLLAFFLPWFFRGIDLL